MKIIKYKTLEQVDRGTKENPNIESYFANVKMDWSESNEEIAKKEAHNGEYTIEDDGQPEPNAKPTDAERITELEEALELILAGVTE